MICQPKSKHLVELFLERNDHAATSIMNAQECITIAYTMQVILRNIPNLSVTVGGVAAPFKKKESVVEALTALFNGGAPAKTPSKLASRSSSSTSTSSTTSTSTSSSVKSSTKNSAKKPASAKAKVSKVKVAPKTEVKTKKKKTKQAIRRKSVGGT